MCLFILQGTTVPANKSKLSSSKGSYSKSHQLTNMSTGTASAPSLSATSSPSSPYMTSSSSLTSPSSASGHRSSLSLSSSASNSAYSLSTAITRKQPIKFKRRRRECQSRMF
eukprot:Awhi_evm1s9604